MALPHPAHVQQPDLAAGDELRDAVRETLEEIRAFRGLRRRFDASAKLSAQYGASEQVARRSLVRLRKVQQRLRGYVA